MGYCEYLRALSDLPMRLCRGAAKLTFICRRIYRWYRASRNGVLLPSSIIQSSTQSDPVVHVYARYCRYCAIHLSQCTILPIEDHRGGSACLRCGNGSVYMCLRHGSTWRVLLSRRLRRSASFCTMSITNADIKASGELAVGPLLSRKRVDSSTGSSLEKDAFKGHATIGHASGTGHGIDPSKHSATFETSGNESFFVPIEKYEGRHRYDPTFEWEPLEERKLVRKVCTHSQTISCLVDQS